MENPTKRPSLEGPSAPKTFFSLSEPKCVLKRTYNISTTIHDIIKSMN